MKALVKIFLLITIFSSVVPVQAAPAAVDITTPAELEAFLDGVIGSQMQENHVPGTVLTVVKDGAVFLSKGYGYADLETRTPVDPERTLFRPGSVSKLFIWTAVMQLAEQGRLDLDADINTYLDFAVPEAFSGPITLRHLLTHTSGFEEANQGLVALQPEGMKPLGEYLATHIPARVFPPGSVMAYSNYGASLTAYIVERVSGLSFDAYVEQNIFVPLGMDHSTFRQPLPESLSAEMASGYNFSNGAYQKGDFELIQSYPAGSASVTAADMARFMIAHLQNGTYAGQRILQEATSIQMRQSLFSHDPRVGGMAYGFFENTVSGQPMVWHGGDTVFFHTGLLLFPEQDLGLYISTNGVNGDGVVAAVIESFLDRYYTAGNTKVPAPSADFKERIAPYLGEYLSARSNFTTFEKVFALFDPIRMDLTEDGYLVLSMYGEEHQYIEIEPGLLQDRVQPAKQMTYGVNEAGQRYFALTYHPFDFIQLPWYANPNLHLELLLAVLILFGIALLRWSYGFLKSLRLREPQPVLSRLAHWNAGLFGLLFISLVICFLVMLLDFVPVLDTPRFLFIDGAAPLLGFVTSLPRLLFLTGLAMPVFMFMSWVKKFWSLSGRIFYTLLTLGALAGVWMLAYWNFLKI
ncbi:MAG: serine hydrolase domain-containing protein [Chloroflexota bacterium]